MYGCNDVWMLWYGVLRCGVILYGMVWYGMEWNGMVWNGMVWNCVDVGTHTLYHYVYCILIWRVPNKHLHSEYNRSTCDCGNCEKRVGSGKIPPVSRKRCRKHLIACALMSSNSGRPSRGQINRHALLPAEAPTSTAAGPRRLPTSRTSSSARGHSTALERTAHPNKKFRN